MVKIEDMLSQIANFGFPIVVCVYLLVRIEGKLDQLTGSIHELANVITRLEN